MTLRTLVRYATLLLCGLLMAAPLFYLLSASLMSAQDARAFPPHLLPPNVVWHNYAEAYEFLSARAIVNSFVFSIGIVAAQLVISIPAGFALATIPFRWTGLLLGVILVPMFVPANMTLIPLYIITYQLGLVGTYAGMILPVAGQTAFAMLLFRQFFAGLPPGLIEAARLDGAGWPRVLTLIALPLARPALAAYCSISFLTAWNTYIWPQVVAPDREHQVMTVALAPLAQGQYTLMSPSVGLAAAVISMTPVLIIFLAFQKWYIKGVVGTGLE
ncbi:carbohydrate ABC transporter permease [Nonomuraea sp. NEAU-A123]|uniref:carbohydrate ABC transporter permease n=1 Tax=Nonomuraea sp. NEAU-A123 TaxID=2839649 RepID=UPI001BE4CB9F|nr:carbohydrate ABC transporter permease [Nonomuraea sp. NEAU-A123]MBT2231879.1 carbohydrate ABC transporter permease [Nonomuraea sp. NEAU-A123]